MATVWQPDALWTQQIGGRTGVVPGAPAQLSLGSHAMADKHACRCSSGRNPAVLRKGVVGEGLPRSRDGRRQGEEQELLWRQFFLDPTVWWDNRRDKKSSRSPDFRRKGSGEVLWLDNFLKPAWVDEQLVALDMQMSHGASPSGSDVGVTPVTVSSLCQQGKPTEAVEALEFLAQTDCRVSESLVYAVLKLCAAKKDLVLGRRVHYLSVKLGYESDAFLGNHILRMYASAGRLQEAMDVFTRVGQPDAFIWSSIISAHAQHRKPKEAILLYHEMCRSGVTADAHVFVAALQACALASDLESGRKVHSDVLHSSIASNLFVGNSLVDMYAKCGKLDDARQAFEGMGVKDVVTWNSLIAGYANHGHGQQALLLHEQMEQEGLIAANQVTFASLLKACASTGALQKGRQLHLQIVGRGQLGNLIVSNCLVDMYAKCGEMEDARQVFDGLSSKDVVTWTALIAGYANHGLGQEALLLYGRMKQEGLILADHVTFASLLKACANAGAAQKGIQLYHEMRSSGLKADAHVFVAALQACAVAADLESGRQVHFDLLHSGVPLNLFVGNSLVDMYAKCGDLENARRVFNGLSSKNVVTWNALIAGYANNGLAREALLLHEQMEVEGLIVADSVTFSCLLKACASTGALQLGRRLHSQIGGRGQLEIDMMVGTCLVDMYAKCGEPEEARRVFDSLATKDAVTWNALIAGYGACDEGQKALACFEEMQGAGVHPNDVTFTCLLVACSHAGLVNEGRKHFDAMFGQHGIKPATGHYTCMVDLLGRAGHLDEAEKVLSSYESQNDVVGLTSLLNACKRHGDVERGIRCFESLVRLDPQRASTYVLMANVYADAGRWADVDRIEKQRVGAGANKKPAVAGIEVGKQVHTFVVGDRREDISLKVESVNVRLKEEGGHVPHTNLVLKPLSEKDKEELLCGHAEKLALAYGLLNTPSGTPLLVTKNLRMCSDCHSSTEIMSRVERRDIVVRDAYRVHRFADGCCTCKGRP